MEYETLVGLPSENELREIWGLVDKILPPMKWSRFFGTLEHRHNLLILTARDHKGPVGFKIGYEERPERFYSWMGGVLPEYRGQGIAAELMARQHAWCTKQGYRAIQTRTTNYFKLMLMVNLKAGFDIIGTYTDKNGKTKIILEKRLR